MKTVIAVSLALVVTATAAAEPNPGRSKAQDLGLIPGGGLNVDNPKRAVPWGKGGNVWQTTTRNTVCRYLPAMAQIRCMTRHDGFTLALRQRSIWTYDNAVNVPRNAPVLRWGQYLKRGPFRCISRMAYLSCFNLQTKHGFELSRNLYALWNRPRWSCEPSGGVGEGSCSSPDVPETRGE